MIAKRLAAARAEISHFTEFDYVIINDKFDAAVRDLTSIVLTSAAASSPSSWPVTKI